MKVVSFFICEQAVAHVNTGSIDVLTYFKSNFWPEQFPWQARFSIFYHLYFDGSDKGDHIVKIKLHDADGNENLLHHFSLVVESVPYEWVDCRLSQSMNFPKTGKYKLSVEIDSKELDDYSIVILPKQKETKNLVGFQQSALDQNRSS